MKHWIKAVIAAAAVVASAGVAWRVARAQHELPAKMDARRAAQLDAAFAHAQPYLTRIGEICAEYKIPVGDYLTGRVTVNYETGDIYRPELPGMPVATSPRPAQPDGGVQPGKERSK